MSRSKKEETRKDRQDNYRIRVAEHETPYTHGRNRKGSKDEEAVKLTV